MSDQTSDRVFLLDRRGFIKVSGSSALAIWLAGCGGGDSGGGATGQLSVALSGGPDTLDPHTTIAGTDWIPLANIYDGLFMRDYTSDAQPARTIPGLATEVDIADDARTYTFTLRTGVRFHDGAPWNAEAAVFNFRRWFDDSFEHYYGRANATVEPFVGGIEDFDAPDEQTFRVRLEESRAGWFDYLAGAPTFFMVSPRAIENDGNSALGNHGVGTGPFKVREYRRNTRLVLERNPDYWGDAPEVEELTIVPVPDESARVGGMLSGRYAVAHEIPPDSIGQIEANDEMELKLAGKPVTFGFGGDTRNGPWSDPRVREAVSLAIDREGLSEQILRGAAVPATQFYGLGNPAFDDSLEPLPHDPERATQLLRDAGYERGLQFRFLTSTSAMGVPDPPRILEKIQSDLEGVGIQSEIDVLEWTAYLGRWTEGTPPARGDVVPIYTMAMGWDTNMLLESYAASASHPPDGVNFVWYENADVDRLLGEAQQAESEEGLVEKLRAAQRAMLEDEPYVFVFHGRTPFAIRDGVDWTPANTWAQRWSRAALD